MQTRPNFHCSLILLLLSLTWGWSTAAMAGLHRCTAADGSVSYRDTPCDEGEQSELRSMPGDALSAEMRQQLGNAGFHPSWFESPRHLSQRVQCTAAICACGYQRTNLGPDRLSALLDAMLGLPGDWKAQLAASQRWDEMGSRQSSFPAVREEVERLACRVAMRQRIVAELYPEVAPATMETHQQRVNALQAIDAQCVAPKETGWTQSEAAKQWADCKARNQSAHNEAVRAQKQTGGGYRMLQEAIESLRKPRQR